MSPGNKAAAPAGIEHITLYVAIEISRKSWVIGLKSPAGERIGVYTLAAADVRSLQELIEQQQAGAECALGRKPRILCCHEAGYEGFWPARWLDWAMDVETIVLDPASLLVNRKAKQRKTDRIDARKMVGALLAHDRGDAAVLSRVRIPSVEAEDRKRLQRERLRLVKIRTSLTNTIKGLLMLHGVFGLEPRGKSFEAKFAEVTTAYGEPFPPRARQEILRLFELLSHVERQIAQVEAERDAVVRESEALVAPVAGGDAGPGKQDGRTSCTAVTRTWRWSKPPSATARPSTWKCGRSTYARRAVPGGHALVVMFAYALLKELRARWNEQNMTVAEGLDQYASLCATHVHIRDNSPYQLVPKPRPAALRLFDAARLPPSKALPSRASRVRVTTKRKLPERRKTKLFQSDTRREPLAKFWNIR